MSSADSALALQQVENMRVRQSKIHAGDTGWYVETANGFVVSKRFEHRDKADADLEWRRARVIAEAYGEEVPF